jgi:gamma-glutamylcyclotransferase (GGCT)/AIG2-like uncharacterized protein YtfP
VSDEVELKLFVYGTLKRGGRNHDRFCRGALSIEPARVRGRLYLAAAGYPVLIVPRFAVLANGSADRVADLSAQSSVPVSRVSAEDAEENVVGELMTFGDPQARLAAFDELEDFHPGGSSLYARVLLAVRRHASDEPVAAWAYVEGDRLRAAGSRFRR